MTAFNAHHFEKKLALLKDSQESIQLLSTWCLSHRQHHKNIVTCWLKVLKKVKLEHRLTLFYLANDVIQYSKRKNYEFVESWGTALQRATTMVRDDKVKDKILRIFKIWGERGVYDESFVADLSGLMSLSSKKKTPEPEPDVPDPLDFHPPVLFVKIRSCHKLEDDTDLRLKRLNETHQSFSDADALRKHLKDRRQGDDVVAEVEEGVKKMNAYMRALEAEIEERKRLIVELDLAEKYYEAQKGEAKLVVNAYKNFGNRVKNLKRHLDERLPSFACPSPIPSPDINAPSPSPDCDIDLPEDPTVQEDDFSFIPGLSGDMSHAAQDQSLENCFASFLGAGSLPFDFQKTLFSESSGDPGNSSEGKPIEVINMRNDPMDSMESSLSNFLKTLGSLGGSSPLLSNPPPSTLSFSTPPPTQPYAPVPHPTTTEYDYSSLGQVPAPVPPPPLPPNMFNILPPKFPMWGNEGGEPGGWEEEVGVDESANWLTSGKDLNDTPESPPICEKEGFDNPVVYDDSAPTQVLGSSVDVDHRMTTSRQMDVDQRRLHILPPPSIHKAKVDVDHRNLRKIDVDHRNLISLTGSPGQDAGAAVPHPPPTAGWPTDQDYRSVAATHQAVLPRRAEGIDVDYRVPPPPPPPLTATDETRDNVESVDMDMSDEETSDGNMSLESPSKKERHGDNRSALDKELQSNIRRSDQSPITFNINNPGGKMLKVSPLNESNDDGNVRRHSFIPGMKPMSAPISNNDAPNREPFVPPGVSPSSPRAIGIRPPMHCVPMLNNRPPFRPGRPPGPPPGPPPGHPRMMNRHLHPPNMNNPPPSASSPPVMNTQLSLKNTSPVKTPLPLVSTPPTAASKSVAGLMDTLVKIPESLPCDKLTGKAPNTSGVSSKQVGNGNGVDISRPSDDVFLRDPLKKDVNVADMNGRGAHGGPHSVNVAEHVGLVASSVPPMKMNEPPAWADRGNVGRDPPPMKVNEPPEWVDQGSTGPMARDPQPMKINEPPSWMDQGNSGPTARDTHPMKMNEPPSWIDQGNSVPNMRDPPPMKMNEPPSWADRGYGGEPWEIDDAPQFPQLNEWDRGGHEFNQFNQFAHEQHGRGFNPRSRPNGRGGGPRIRGGGQNRRMFGGHGAPRMSGRGSFGGHPGNYGGW